MASDSPGFIDLSGNERPERATMIVQAWQQKKRSEKKLYLDGPDGTLADFERKLREEGLDEGYRVVQCHLHALQPPPARYNTVMALQPTNRSQSKASGGGSRGSRSGGSGEPKAPRELTTLFWNCPVSFDFLAKVTAPDFTPAQGIKEIIDNAVQSLVFLFQIDQPRLMQHEKPQIVILIDLQRGALRIVDNGGGLNPQQMRAWAHIGISRNRDRVQEMLEAKPDSPLITGLFSALASAFGIGSKGGGASLTCVQNEVRGKLTLYSYQGPDVDGNDNLQRIVFDLQEAQRREKEKDDSPWTRPYNGNLELSSQPELKKLMSRPGWGDRITCFEVAGLSPTVLEKLRDRGGAAIFNEFVETWAYSFHSPLYDELVEAGLDQLRNPKPLHITASVEVSDGDGAPQVIDLNALAQQKYAKVLRSPSSAQQPSSSMQPQRRSGMRGGLDAGGFYYPIEVSDGDKKGIALLHLRYYPIKALEETLPEGCEPGFDVRWQGRKLTDEKMRLLRFMDPGRGGLSAAGCGGPQKELKMLLEKVGHRVFGDLLLNHSFAVNKNKSLLLITGEESSSGSIKLVKRLLDKPATEWEPLPGGLGVIDALLQWLKQSIMQDEEFRFEWEDGDVESAPAGFSGWVTKVLKLGTKEFKAPRNRHGHAAEEKPLRLCLHKDLKKKFDKKTNAVYAEVHSFRFTEDTIENREDVESRCRAASDGHVLFWAWTDKRSEHLEAMPLKHIAQLNESTGISDKDWKTHLKRQQEELEKTKPKAIVCATDVDTPIVSKDTGLSLEDAFERKVDGDTLLWFALCVTNKDGEGMSGQQLSTGGFSIKLTARHQRSGREKLEPAQDPRRLLKGDRLAWWQPTLDESGAWVCSAAVVGKDGATVCKPWSVTLTVAEPARYHSFRAEWDDDNDKTPRLGCLLPPLVATAYDVTESIFKLESLPPINVAIVEQPEGQDLRIETDETRGGKELRPGGQVCLYGLVLRGTLAEGKAGRERSGSIQIEVTLGDLQPLKKKIKGIKCGRPAQLTLLNPDDFTDALAAAAPLPPLRMRCVDKDGNPCPVEVTLVQEHDGDAESEDPFEHTGKGKSGKANSPFIIPATGELEIGAKPAFRVNGDAMQHDKEVCATLTFGAWLDPEDDEDADATCPLVVRLAQLEQPEQPELKRLTLFVRGHDGASTPAVSCDDEFVVELHGADENGNARRIDLAEIGASTQLMRCGDVSAVMATQSPWVQSGDVLEKRMALGGKAGELDIELDPSLGYYSMCDALRVNLIAGDPAKVVASLASGDATVENGKELVVKAHLADEYDNKVEATQGVEWNSLQEVQTARQEDSQGSEGGGDQLYLLLQRKLKGAAATLKAVVVTARPLHEPTSFSLQISAQVKQQDGAFHTFEVEEPLQVTVSPGRKVVAKLDTSFVQVHSNDDGAMVEMDESRVSQLPQPDPTPHVATPGSILPPLAVRVAFENGGYLERPKVCKLGLKLNDTTRNLCLVDERPGGNEDRARKEVELHIAGQESVQALLVEGLQAPEVPGEYELELCLSEFGGIKGLPTKEVLSRAERVEVRKVIRIAVVSGPAHALQPKIPLEVVGNEEVALQGPLACLVDACGNELTANNAVTLTLRRHAASSQDVQGTPLALVQPTAPLCLVDGVLKLDKLQLSGVAPSGQYELKFALQDNDAVSGTILIDYENPDEQGQRKEAESRRKEQLRAQKERLKEAEQEERALAKRQKTLADAAKSDHEQAVKELADVRGRLAQKRSHYDDHLRMDEDTVKRVKASHGLGQDEAALAAARAGSQQASALVPKLQRKLAELEQSLTVALELPDGEGSYERVRKRRRDFPMDRPNEDDDGHVRYELRQVDAQPVANASWRRPRGGDASSSSSQQPFGLFKVVSRSGNEVSAERMGEQTLRDDHGGEYLLDALQRESLFETGRADERISEVIAALLGGDDCALLAPLRAGLPPPPAGLPSLLGRLEFSVLAPPSAREAGMLPPVDAETGLLKVGANGGAIHPPGAAGASYLINRICCDDAETRVAWYRALQSAGCYGDAILFDDASAMYAHCEQAPEVAVCIALADESAAGGFAMVSHGRYGLLRKTQAVCKLGPIKEQDAEQVLRGTADGKRVVEFELATEELRELQAEETSKAAEEAAAKVEKDKAEAAAQELLANELNPLREKIKQLKEATGTPASSKKRARSS